MIRLFVSHGRFVHIFAVVGTLFGRGVVVVVILLLVLLGFRAWRGAGKLVSCRPLSGRGRIELTGRRSGLFFRSHYSRFDVALTDPGLVIWCGQTHYVYLGGLDSAGRANPTLAGASY